MGVFDFLTGGAATGVKEVAGSIGTLAKDIRQAITGDMPPELEVKLRELEQQGINLQVELNKVEAANSNLFVSGWRPAVGWICALAFGYVVLNPILCWFSTMIHIACPPNIDSDLFVNVLGGMLGLAGLRSFEKSKKVNR